VTRRDLHSVLILIAGWLLLMLVFAAATGLWLYALRIAVLLGAASLATFVVINIRRLPR
jgi:hypothetical protein